MSPIGGLVKGLGSTARKKVTASPGGNSNVDSGSPFDTPGDTDDTSIFPAENEIEITAIRSQGPGGQNVNKVSSAVHLRFDIGASSLPGVYKDRLLKLRDRRITRNGVVVIKTQKFRSQDKNRMEAIQRLHELIARATEIVPERKPTRPTVSSQKKRLASKTHRGELKISRKKFSGEPEA
jgi:ribosome-associated protein